MTARFAALTVFALAFGVEEAIVVVYLRHLPSFATLAYRLEIVREFCTLLVIGGVAYLAAPSAALRARAFAFAFGVWDIVYYLGLWQFSGFPRLTDYDVLFLIPVPWIAPVWAPVCFALSLVLIGCIGTLPQRRALLASGFGLGIFSFVYQTIFGAHAYPVWLFAIAFGLVLLALPVGHVPERLRQF